MRDNPLRELLGEMEGRDDAWTALDGRLDELDQRPRPKSQVVRTDVLDYLEDTASLIDALAVAVEGNRPDWAPLLVAARGYLGNRHDLVSDEQGVLGVLDDAYLCRALLRHGVAGNPNSPVDVAEMDAESTVRALLGAPVVATLDVAAAQTVRDLGPLAS